MPHVRPYSPYGVHHPRFWYSSQEKPCVSFHHDDRSEAHFRVVVTVEVAVEVGVVVAVVATVVVAVVSIVLVCVDVCVVVAVLVGVDVGVDVAVLVWVVEGVVARRISTAFDCSAKTSSFLEYGLP